MRLASGALKLKPNGREYAKNPKFNRANTHNPASYADYSEMLSECPCSSR